MGTIFRFHGCEARNCITSGRVDCELAALFIMQGREMVEVDTCSGVSDGAVIKLFPIRLDDFFCRDGLPGPNLGTSGGQNHEWDR